MDSNHKKQIKEFVHDLNWINRQLQDYTARVAFLIVAKPYETSKNFNTIPFFQRQIDSMYNTSLLIAGVLYDKRNDALSLAFLLKRIVGLSLLVNVGAPHAVRAIRKKLYLKKNLVDKILASRNKLFAHSNTDWARRADYNRNVLNAHSSRRIAAFVQHATDMKAMMASEKELKELMEFTISIMKDIIKLLGAPDRILSSCRNDREWKFFYKARIADAEKYFKVVTTHDWR